MFTLNRYCWRHRRSADRSIRCLPFTFDSLSLSLSLSLFVDHRARACAKSLQQSSRLSTVRYRMQRQETSGLEARIQQTDSDVMAGLRSYSLHIVRSARQTVSDSIDALWPNQSANIFPLRIFGPQRKMVLIVLMEWWSWWPFGPFPINWMMRYPLLFSQNSVFIDGQRELV